MPATRPTPPSSPPSRHTARVRRHHPARRARAVAGTSSVVAVVALTGAMAVANRTATADETTAELADAGIGADAITDVTATSDESSDVATADTNSMAVRADGAPTPSATSPSGSNGSSRGS